MKVHWNTSLTSKENAKPIWCRKYRNLTRICLEYRSALCQRRPGLTSQMLRILEHTKIHCPHTYNPLNCMHLYIR